MDPFPSSMSICRGVEGCANCSEGAFSPWFEGTPQGTPTHVWLRPSHLTILTCPLLA